MQWVADYISIPFVDGGRDRRGVDCWGLVQLVYRDRLGVELPDYGEISASDLLRIAKRMKQDVASWIKVEEPKALDVVLMLGTPTGPDGRTRAVNTHAGVMADSNHVLHTQGATGAVLVPRDHFTVRHRITGFYRWAA